MPLNTNTQLSGKRVTTTSSTNNGIAYIPPSSTNLFNKSPSATTAKSDKDAEMNTRNVFAAAIFGAITFVHSYLLFRK